MKEIKIDDIFFKDEIDYKDLDESIYTQFAKTMAKNVDIDLAKTPLVDILTGYTRYRILQSKIDKALDYIEKYLQEHIIDDLPDEESKFETEDGIPIPNAKEQLLNILKGEDK